MSHRENIVQKYSGHCGANHIKHIACDLGAGVRQLIKGIVEVVTHNLHTKKQHELAVIGQAEAEELP